MKQKNTFEKIYDAVKEIPYGKVASYSTIARMAGNPRWARVVGYALHVNPDPENIKCYRVVNKDGRVSSAFAFGGGNAQEELLKSEGIEVIGGYVDMNKYSYIPAYFLLED